MFRDFDSLEPQCEFNNTITQFVNQLRINEWNYQTHMKQFYTTY